MAGITYLEFEKPLVELEERIKSLRESSGGDDASPNGEIQQLEDELKTRREAIFSQLTRWQRIQLARHPQRPYAEDYLELIAERYIPLHGDRGYADDRALIGGFATISGIPLMVIGQQKGRSTKEKLSRNFGMCHPEGYRKAMRLMHLAERYGRPVLILIDTPGAFPGIGAEERGQAEAIARNIRDMAMLRTPIVIVVIGEGASGGALGIGIGDRILMLENSWYSVISPEACAAILWKNHPNPIEKAPDAAEALKPCATDVNAFGVIDSVLPEPLGGAHRDPERQAEIITEAVVREIQALIQLPLANLLQQRHAKFRTMGEYREETA